jgi:hypothetical protein
MKTITRRDEIRREKDNIAELMVNNEGWKYIPKSEWKKIRANTPQKQKEDTQPLNQNLTDKKLRKARKDEKRRKHGN